MRGRWLRGAPPQSPPSTPAPRAQTEGGLLDPLTEGQALRSSRASKQAVSTSPECSLSAFTGLGAWDRLTDLGTDLYLCMWPKEAPRGQVGLNRPRGSATAIASLSCHQLAQPGAQAGRRPADRMSPSEREVTCGEGCSQLSPPGPIYTGKCQSLRHVQLFETPWTVACRLLCPHNFPDKNIAVGSHSLLQGIFPTQVSNPGLLNCRQILYHPSPREALESRETRATL